MPGPGLAGVERQLVRLHDLAAALVEPWAAAAAANVTAGQERAILRLLGVGGVDAVGRPLAGEVVDRYLAGGSGRLGGGVILPFAVALLEYDLAPQALAMDVASGAVDLGLEAELLRDPVRRTAAETAARSLVAAGLDRVDANRTARRELMAVLGDPPRPWIGTTLTAPVAGDASLEAQAAVRAGADVLRVEVPSGRELAVRLGAVGLEPARWLPREDGAVPADNGPDLAPAGSQRGLATLRTIVDGAAAERAGYVRLATCAPALSAPEAAVVAVSERVDLVESDPIDEIVATGVDPERAIADHAFARRLYRRAEASILIGPGPLVVAPDLARGVPSSPASRAGRGLALQLLSARLAAAEGLAPDQVLLEAMPAWLLGEHRPFVLAAAEVCIRRALLPDNPLTFSEPPESPRSASWPFLLGALLPASPAGTLVLRRSGGRAFGPVLEATRAAAAVAGELAGALDPGRLRGRALEHATATLASAVETLEQLSADGWGTILGEGPDGAPGATGWLGRGSDSVIRRTDPFDPIVEALAGQPV